MTLRAQRPTRPGANLRVALLNSSHSPGALNKRLKLAFSSHRRQADPSPHCESPQSLKLQSILTIGDRNGVLSALNDTMLERACNATEGSANDEHRHPAKLRSSTGCITLDPAYGNTGSCQSAITYIDGDAGILRYRGIPIEQFEKSPNFVEVCWLLIFGELPNQAEYDRFSALLTKHAMLNESMKHHFEGFPSHAPPMAVLSAMINTLYCFHPEINETASENEFEIVAARLLSKIRTIAAFAYRNSTGRPYNYPDPNRPYVSNFLHMMFSEPHAPHDGDDIVRIALNLILILHADHEQAGVGALWGPLHGGANVAVLEMLEQIHEGSLSVEEYMEKAKDKSSGIKLMGFGHRVYKNFDPRAKILQNIADRLLNYLGMALFCVPLEYRPVCSPSFSLLAACPAGSRTGVSSSRKAAASHVLARSIPVRLCVIMYPSKNEASSLQKRAVCRVTPAASLKA